MDFLPGGVAMTPMSDLLQLPHLVNTEAAVPWDEARSQLGLG
jgi:hypothetical protein